MTKIINVLIVEDSRVVSEYIHYLLSNDPAIHVIGNVSNGKAAIEFLKSNKPDVITMDINMPIMNGLEATRIIMETSPVPIIIVSASQNIKDVRVSLDALSAGAVAIMEKPAGIGHPKENGQSKKLVNMVKLMAEVKVISRKPAAVVSNTAKNPVHHRSCILPKMERIQGIKIISIGVSSGGPQVLQKIFTNITSKFPYPIVVVQHISKGFLEGLVTWLAGTLQIQIHIATNNEVLLPGHIYFAPNGFQIQVKKYGKTVLTHCEKNNGICPSVAFLFKSIKQEFGEKSMALLLTGMGSDGSKELKTLRDSGALTIAQDKESSLIYGMPGVAAELDAAEYILSSDQIRELLKNIETHSVLNENTNLKS